MPLSEIQKSINAITENCHLSSAYRASVCVFGELVRGVFIHTDSYFHAYLYTGVYIKNGNVAKDFIIFDFGSATFRNSSCDKNRAIQQTIAMINTRGEHECQLC